MQEVGRDGAGEGGKVETGRQDRSGYFIVACFPICPILLSVFGGQEGGRKFVVEGWMGVEGWMVGGGEEREETLAR